MSTEQYETMNVEGGRHVKMWTRGVPVESKAKEQLANTARMPFVFKHLAAMPDVHLGKGATVGSVVATKGAIIPAAVGVDIGCGMAAVRTTLTASDLPDDLRAVRTAIEKAVPHGFTARSGRDAGSWETAPNRVARVWAPLEAGYRQIVGRHPKLSRNNHPVKQLGTLGSGNHFLEVCLDESGQVWFMLHSGSRGVGNRIGQYFIERARHDMRSLVRNLPDV